MAEPIKRDTFEAVGETAASTIKTAAGAGLLAAAAAFAVGAVVFAALPAAVIAAGAALTGASVMGALTSGLGMLAVGVPAVVGGLGGAVGASSGIGIVAGVGALVGAFRGVSRVSSQNSAYAAKMRESTVNREAEMVAVHNNAMQMAQQTLVPQFEQVLAEREKQAEKRGAEMVMAKLQEHAKHAEHPVAHAAHEHKKESWAADVEKQNAAKAQTTGAQIG